MGTSPSSSTELSDEDRIRIKEAFEELMVPKLRAYHARIGSLGCDFAGPEYADWIACFRSSADGYEIIDFEYDPDARGLDLK
ncbi:MAG: hypothetical protein ACLFUE_10710 [Desulfobacteraceae bacterium]